MGFTDVFTSNLQSLVQFPNFLKACTSVTEELREGDEGQTTRDIAQENEEIGRNLKFIVAFICTFPILSAAFTYIKKMIFGSPQEDEKEEEDEEDEGVEMEERVDSEEEKAGQDQGDKP